MGATSDGDKLHATANQSASETISAVRVVQSYNMRPGVIGRYRATLKASVNEVGNCCE